MLAHVELIIIIQYKQIPKQIERKKDKKNERGKREEELFFCCPFFFIGYYYQDLVVIETCTHTQFQHLENKREGEKEFFKHLQTRSGIASTHYQTHTNTYTSTSYHSFNISPNNRINNPTSKNNVKDISHLVQ